MMSEAKPAASPCELKLAALEALKKSLQKQTFATRL
jgi:hypothetical protein